jgi:putative copper resistance protein D
MDIPLRLAFGAGFARFGLVAAAAAALITFVARGPLTRSRILALFGLSMAALAAQLATSHAAAQVDGRVVLLVADFLHMAAAGAWIGGIPYFLLVLYGTDDGRAHGLVGRRFSLLLVWTVAVLVAAGLVMAVDYIGSVEAIYGTAYGVMVVTKVVLLLALLFFGAMNNRILERMTRDASVPALRVRRFAEVEIAIGFTVLFAAASLTSQPPAVDLVNDRASLAEIAERFAPRWPRFTSPDRDQLALFALQAQLDAAAAKDAPRPQAYVPGEGILPPRNAADIAWSEYNHHLAGLLVLAIGLLALLDRTGKAPWARNWPLLFLLLGGFLWFKADPEVWPLGDVGFWASLRDPEVVQHRLFVFLITGFAAFEWRVRTGRITRPRAALVFPLVVALGAALLLTHSHALSNIKEQLLIELSHVPLALAGMTAGAARWLELRLDGPGARVAGWVWPAAFVVVGVILLAYREA